MRTLAQPAKAHPVMPYVIGSTAAAAVAVLTSVFLGAPFDRPIPFVVAMAIAGVAIGHVLDDRVRLSGAPAVAALVVWGMVVLWALVYVVAAIALSRLE